jgi:hypothetical protein
MPTKPLLTLKRLSEANTERHDTEYPDNVEWDPTDWALTATDAMGAVARLVRNYQNGDTDLDGEIFDEIADGVTALDLLCTELGGSLDQVIARRFNAKSVDLESNTKLPVRS